MPFERFEIAERFRGPPRSGNGGYTCGRVARHLHGPVAVRLRQPPPLSVELRLEYSDEEARLFREDAIIAEARRCAFDLPAPPSPSYAQAEAAASSFLGFTSHTFPGCFVCGPERRRHDGLRIFPGALDHSATIASPWIPEASLADDSGKVRPEFLWAALDCPGAFAHFPLPDGVAIVLGELTVSIVGEIAAGDPCVVLGWPSGAEGRRRFAGTAIYGPNGGLVAVARAVWIEVPLSTWS